jgi:hypothetical protein
LAVFVYRFVQPEILDNTRSKAWYSNTSWLSRLIEYCV